MGWLSAIFRGKGAPPLRYVESGSQLARELQEALALPGWENGTATLSPTESRAVELRISEFQAMANQQMGGETYMPSALADKLRSTLASEALRDLATLSWKYESALPENWKEHVSTYLKAWSLLPADAFALLELGRLLAKAGLIAEAKRVLNVVLLFPAFAESYYSEPQGSKIAAGFVELAKNSLRDLE